VIVFVCVYCICVCICVCPFVGVGVGVGVGVCVCVGMAMICLRYECYVCKCVLYNVCVYTKEETHIKRQLVITHSRVT